MAKKNGASAFDELLESIETPEDREALSGLAEKHPALKESFLRQSEFSRRMQEVDKELKYAKGWQGWEQENWVRDPNDPEIGWTKRELELQQETQRLKEERDEFERRALLNPLGDDEVDLTQLESSLLGKVRQDIAAKEQQFSKAIQDSTGVNARLTLDAAELMLDYRDEFGEKLDTNAFLQAALEKGRTDLKSFYNQEFVAEKRTQRQQNEWKEKEAKLNADFQSQLEAKQKEFEERAEKLKGMGAGGLTPSEATPSEMGAFQRQYLGVNQSTDGVRSNGVPDKAVLGSGQIAATAAQRDMEKAAGRI